MNNFYINFNYWCNQLRICTNRLRFLWNFVPFGCCCVWL